MSKESLFGFNGGLVNGCFNFGVRVVIVSYLVCCLIGSIFALALCVLVSRKSVSAIMITGVLPLIFSALLIVAVYLLR